MTPTPAHILAQLPTQYMHGVATTCTHDEPQVLTQYMRMKPCILPRPVISSCDAFHSSSWVLPPSSCSLRSQEDPASTIQ